jgi:hypothetical protein
LFLTSDHCVAPDIDTDLDLNPDQDPDLDQNPDIVTEQDPDIDTDQDLNPDLDLDPDHFCFLLLSIYFRMPKLSTVARRTYQVPFGSGCASVHSLSVNAPVS